MRKNVLMFAKTSALMSVCIIALFALTSASKGRKSGEVWIEKSWKENAKPLVLEEIGTKDLLEFAECCYVFDDIMVVQNYKNSGKYLLEFFDMKDMKLLRQALMIGNGPGEVINAIIINSGKYLTVDDFMKSRFARIDMAGYLNDKESVIKFKDYGLDSQRMDLWDEKRFICINPYRFINKKLKINQDEPRFLLVEGTDDIPQKDGQIDAMKINYGDILINEKTGKVCFVSHEVPAVEFYDSALKHLCTLNGPDDLTPKYIVKNNNVDYDGNFVQSYIKSCYNGTDIWLAYQGRMLDPMTLLANEGEIEKSRTYIFKLDWDGNVKDSFLVGKDKKIKSMSTGSGGELYLSCEVDGILKLFKAKQ